METVRHKRRRFAPVVGIYAPRIVRAVTIVLFASAAGCGPAERFEARSFAADTAELRHRTREFVEGFNSGDVDLVMRFYDDRYVDVNMSNPMQTWAERREYYRRIIERRDTRVAVTPEEIVVSGDYAVLRGTILLTPAGSDTTRGQRTLRYMELARRSSAGWKVIWGIDAAVYAQ
jgi:ketosteroid isomerase-like protein